MSKRYLAGVILASVVGLGCIPSLSQAAAVDVTVDTSVIRHSSFGGFGAQMDPHYWWLDVNRDKGVNETNFTNVIAKRWTELNPGYCRIGIKVDWWEAEEGVQTWTSEGMNALVKTLELAKSTGTEVYLTTWFPYPRVEWLNDDSEISNQASTDSGLQEKFARTHVDLFDYLINTKGFTNISHYCMANELSVGQGHGWLAGNMTIFQGYHQKLHDEIQARGLDDQIKLLATDQTAGGWTTIDWAQNNMDDITGIYGVHTFESYHKPDSTSFYSDYLALLSGLAGTSRAKGKDFIVGEFGCIVDGGTYDCAWAWDNNYGLMLSEFALAGLNSGTYAMSAWCFMDMYYSDVNWMRWGTFFTDVENGFAIKPGYYSYGLLTKFFRPNSTVYGVTSSHSLVRAAVARGNVDGKYTIAVVNRDSQTHSVTVDLPGGVASLKRYVYNTASIPTTDGLQDYTGLVPMSDGTFTDSVPPGSLVVYTGQISDGDMIANGLGASNVTTNSATFNGTLASTNGAACAVAVLWGEQNGGATWDWANTNWFNGGAVNPAWTNGTTFSTNMTAADGLAPNKTYYYTFAATNATTNVVAFSPEYFITGEVTVEAGAQYVEYPATTTFTISRPSGCTNEALEVFYTVADGSLVEGVDYTLAASPAVIDAGETNVVLTLTPFPAVGDVTLTLTAGGDKPYPLGTASNATVTVRTAPTIENQPVTDVTTNSATFNGTLTSTGSTTVAQVYVLWGENPNAWANTNTIPEPGGGWTNNTPLGTNLTSDIAANTTYYYTFAVTNAAGTVVVAASPEHFITGEVTVEAGAATVQYPDTTTFTISRPSGCTNEALEVPYTVADGGLSDYTLAASPAIIDAGETNVVLTLAPGVMAGDVELTLTAAATNLYPIGTASNATVTIQASTVPIGGTITETNGYFIHTFTNVGDSIFATPFDIDAEYLVVGGGGGGRGGYNGGGGGGGGVQTGSVAMTVQAYTITVGAGGAGGIGNNSGANGQSSSIAGVTNAGGGVGATDGGGDGAASGTPQSNAGGGDSSLNGGGGGGAGQVGQNAPADAGGAGGDGLASSITGTAKKYGAGGGGGDRTTGGTGGAGGDDGGGAGGVNLGAEDGFSATFYGGGGGGAGDSQGLVDGGSGGSGIVIIRYLDPDAALIASDPVTNVTTTSATFNGTLTSTGGSACAVAVLWGEEDGGATWDWANTNWFNGGVANESWTNGTTFSTNITSGIASNSTYYYRYAATNSASSNVAFSVESFITGEVTVEAGAATVEAPATTTFTISRPLGCTNADLMVSYTFDDGGTGYTLAASPATIDAGETNVVLTLSPGAMGGNVTLTLTAAGDTPYPIGVASNATVTIQASTVPIGGTNGNQRLLHPHLHERRNLRNAVGHR